MEQTPDPQAQSIADATQRATGNGHTLRFATMQYSQRLSAWCNSCTHCNALLYVFDGTFAIGGGAIAFDCALAPAPKQQPLPDAHDHSKRANEQKPAVFTPGNAKNVCAHCGAQSTIGTRCKHCSKADNATINTPQHTQRTTHTPGTNVATIYTAPAPLNAFDRTTVELQKPRLRYTYASTQSGTYTAPCGTTVHTRHVYIPPITTGMPDHVLAIYDCPVCDNYKCIAVLITPGNAV